MNPTFDYEKMPTGLYPSPYGQQNVGMAPPTVGIDRLEGLAYSQRVAQGDISPCENMQFKALQPRFVAEMLRSGLFPRRAFSVLAVIIGLAALVSIGVQIAIIWYVMTFYYFCAGIAVGTAYLVVQSQVILTSKPAV